MQHNNNITCLHAITLETRSQKLLTQQFCSFATKLHDLKFIRSKFIGPRDSYYTRRSQGTKHFLLEIIVTMSEIQLPIGQYEDEDAAASSTDETVEKKKDKKDKKDKKEKKDKKDKKDKRDRKDERDEVTVAIIPSASDALSKVDLPSFLAHSNEVCCRCTCP